MLDTIRERHRNTSIAVLGSGPTLRLYQGKEPVSIAVNGAVLPFDQSTYFVCTDPRSPQRDWFYAAVPTAIRMIASYLTPFDHRCYPDERVRNSLQRQLADMLHFSFADETTLFRQLGEETYTYGSDHPMRGYIPHTPPLPPHIYFQLATDMLHRISRLQQQLASGASASGYALQLAFLMGASDIHLYGCSFDNHSGRNYAYVVKPRQEGGTEKHHAANMDMLIEQIQSQGTRVIVHGLSRLTKGQHVS